ncbi:MAG: 16S rRNA (cytosine(967)-C(5))-methyltransferase RsmB [Desulfobacterales bacterium]|jgi:16S rRNA (cytosine967-C5)-methyltransferase|nr:16S rRNA (cytosine(967)-C(5))-methyltransferase RsmB [Desulfobacterales bacterium]
MTHDPRKTALEVLNTLTTGKKTLDSILHDIPQDDRFLSRRDRALFTAIVYGVLRWRSRLDHIITHFSNTPIQKIEPGVLNILRLGLFQIIYLDRIPDSAAVNTSVEITKQIGASRAAGFVNALLRKSAANHSSIHFPVFKTDPVAFLSAVQSLPGWLAQRWLKRFDKETIMFLCNTINSIPPITIRTNTLKTTREQLILSLESEVARIESTTAAPDGIKLINPKRSIPDLPAFMNGWFQVQDEAAQLVALLLNPQPGESVLDACAGLGGKTAHIAQLMQNRGNVTAMDKDEKKLQQLDSEMQRLNIAIVHTHCHDLNSSLDQKQIDVFDRILLDAPCSGLGVLRRNPDIKWNSTEKSLKRHADIQKRFLENLAPMVKPNGVLVYSVCSIEPEENEGVIRAFLKNRPEFVIDKSPGKLPETMLSQIEPTTGFKTLPILNDMDGFFLARMRRI